MALGARFIVPMNTAKSLIILESLVTKLLDWSLIVSGFTLNFVVIAGAGANLNQIWGIPHGLGQPFVRVLIGISMLNFEKVTAVIGIFTPIVVFIVFALTL